MSNNTKLWPLNQLLDWIDKADSKFLIIKANELSVLLAIAKFCDSNWKSFPSIIRIANLCLKDKKVTEDVLKRLIAKKILVSNIRYKKDGSRDSNEYIIVVDNLWKVGAFSPLPWGRINPYRRGESTPLTNNITKDLTKKHGASRVSPKKDQKPKAQELKQTVKLWEKGNPDYDRIMLNKAVPTWELEQFPLSTKQFPFDGMQFPRGNSKRTHKALKENKEEPFSLLNKKQKAKEAIEKIRKTCGI